MGRVVSLQGGADVRPHTRRSVVKDILPVANNMRQEDADEVRAGCGQTPAEALMYCFFKGDPCMTMVGRSGRPMGMWGVVPQEEGLGRIWLLGTDEMVDDPANRLRFLREAKGYLAKVGERYQVLFNCADARNEVHIKWLRWMGFTFIAEHPNYGAEGRAFLEFVRMNHV